MKKLFMFLSMMFCVNNVAGHDVSAQEVNRHRVVFQLTSDTPKTWDGMLNNIENVLVDLGQDTEVEVVAHSGGLSFLTKATNANTERVEKLMRQGVVFLACENTMQRKNVTKNDLLSGAGTVSSGVGHIIKRQAEGWSYIRITD